MTGNMDHIRDISKDVWKYMQERIKQDGYDDNEYVIMCVALVVKQDLDDLLKEQWPGIMESTKKDDVKGES